MNCLHCNKPVEGKRNTKKYCGNTCKQYAYLNRNFAMPSNLNSVSLISHEIKPDQENKASNSIASTDGNNNVNNDHSTEINKLNLKLTNNHEYKNGLIEEEYEYINAEILDRIQNGYISLNVTSIYFTSRNAGRITQHNFAAFSYMLPRIRCILENLFQLTYKRKLYYRTAICICKALEEMLFSEHVKLLPGDFPFFEDLLRLNDQFIPIAKSLECDKEGIKFILNKTAIVRYIMILSLIRDCTKKEPFHKLFPEIYKSSPTRSSLA